MAEVKFDAPSGTTLEKDSTYWAVFSEISSTDQSYVIAYSELDGPGDLYAAPGWTLDMRGQNKTGDGDWVGLEATLDRAPRLRIVGQVIPSPGVRVTGGIPATLNEAPGVIGQYLLFVNTQPSHSVTITPISSNTDAVTVSSVTFTTSGLVDDKGGDFGPCSRRQHD